MGALALTRHPNARGVSSHRQSRTVHIHAAGGPNPAAGAARPPCVPLPLSGGRAGRSAGDAHLRGQEGRVPLPLPGPVGAAEVWPRSDGEVFWSGLNWNTKNQNKLEYSGTIGISVSAKL